MRPEEKIETFAGPPLLVPKSAKAKFKKNEPPPVCWRATPKIKKPTTRVAKAVIGIPIMLSVPKIWNVAVVSHGCDGAFKKPGRKAEIAGYIEIIKQIIKIAFPPALLLASKTKPHKINAIILACIGARYSQPSSKINDPL